MRQEFIRSKFILVEPPKVNTVWKGRMLQLDGYVQKTA